MWSWNTVVAVVVLLMYPGALAASQQRPSSSSVDSAQRHVDVVREGFARWAPRIRDLVGKDDVVIAIWDGESMARDGVLYQNQYVWCFVCWEPKPSKSRCFSI